VIFQTRKTVQRATMVCPMKSEKGLETVAGLERIRRMTMKGNDALREV